MSLAYRAGKDDDGSPSKQFKSETNKPTPFSPYGTGGDGTLMNLTNIRPLLTRSVTVWIVTILFLVCYIVPSRLRALAENTWRHTRKEGQNKALKLDAATLQARSFCDKISLKQQNITSRININIVAGSFGHSSVVSNPRSVGRPPSRASSRLLASAPVVDTSRVVQLLDSYRMSHSVGYIDGIQDKNLCKRKFVIGTYSCPAQLGERMHEFLNAYAGAVITNRTLIWKYCNRKGCQIPGSDETSCGGLLQRLPWIPSSASVFQRLAAGGCPIDEKKLNETLIVPMARHATSSESLLACCHIDTLSERVVDFGTLERRDFSGLALPGAKLNSDKAMRAAMLFSAGEAVAYGALFRSAFSFTSAGK